jgi:hypothetical protein
VTTAPGHAWTEYLTCVEVSLAVLEDRIYNDDGTNNGSEPARLWWLGFLLRAQRLLRDAALLARSSESADGVVPLCRTAYESAIYAMWVRADGSRTSDLEADLIRVQATQMAQFVDEWKPVAEATRRARLIPLEQIVRQVATWAAETTPTFAYRLTHRPDGTVESEPILSDGEPYASSYVTLYRLLSGLAMHGPALAGGVVDPATGRLLRGRSTPDPNDVLVLVAEFAMASASRCFGWGILNPPTDLTDESRLEWEARHMRLRVAARAVADDDPGLWPEMV